MAWETGWFWLAAGERTNLWVSWGDAWEGVQFIVPEARGGGEARLDVISYGIRSIPRFGASTLFSYWVEVINRGPADTNFVLRGQRVD